jgi:hypothetical protein
MFVLGMLTGSLLTILGLCLVAWIFFNDNDLY